MSGPSGELRRLAAGTLLVSFPGPTVPDWVARLADGGIAGVCLFAGNVGDGGRTVPSRLRAIRDDLVVAIDEEGGDVTRLEAATGSSVPGAAALGAIDDTDLTETLARALGTELAERGIDVDLAPVADVNTDAANPVIGVRSFGADPDLVARHTAAFVTGLQGAGVAACVKHFPGHGATAVDSHLGLPVIDATGDLLHRRELVPFRAAIEAGVALVMAGHLVVPAIDDHPATVSERVLGGLLRGELGFEGAIVTDALDMAGIGGVDAIPTTAVRALAAGADLCCLGPAPGVEVVDATLDAIDGRGHRRLAPGGAARRRRRQGANDRVEARPATTPRRRRLDDRRRGRRLAGASDRRPSSPLPIRGAHVVELEVSPTIAAGAVPWGVAAPLVALDPTTSGERLGDEPVDQALARAQGRPLVVVVRDPHRHPTAFRQLCSLVAARPDAVVVDMGWPVPDPLGGAVRFVTHGASRASGRGRGRPAGRGRHMSRSSDLIAGLDIGGTKTYGIAVDGDGPGTGHHPAPDPGTRPPAHIGPRRPHRAR